MVRIRQSVWDLRLATATVVAIGYGCATASHPSAAPATHSCDWKLTSSGISSAGMQILSRTTQAMYSVGGTTQNAHGYIMLARGRPNWFEGQLVGGGGHVNGAVKTDHVWRVGPLSYTVAYDPASNTASLLDKVVRLDTANVLLVDHIGDTTQRAQLVGTACVHEFDTGDPSVGLFSDSRLKAYIDSRP